MEFYKNREVDNQPTYEAVVAINGIRQVQLVADAGEYYQPDIRPSQPINRFFLEKPA